MMNLRFVVSIVQMFFASIRSSLCCRHDRSETDKVVYVVNQISKKNMWSFPCGNHLCGVFLFWSQCKYKVVYNINQIFPDLFSSYHSGGDYVKEHPGAAISLLRMTVCVAKQKLMLRGGGRGRDIASRGFVVWRPWFYTRETVLCGRRKNWRPKSGKGMVFAEPYFVSKIRNLCFPAVLQYSAGRAGLLFEVIEIKWNFFYFVLFVFHNS